MELLEQNSLVDLKRELRNLDEALEKAKAEEVNSYFDSKEKGELIDFFSGKKDVVALRIKKLGG